MTLIFGSLKADAKRYTLKDSAAVLIRELCAAMLTFNLIARLAPLSMQIFWALSIALREPDITVCDGEFRLAH